MREGHADHPPVARVETVTETHFGVTLADPYRWLEALSGGGPGGGPDGDAGGEAMAWLDGQAGYASSMLAGLPLRDAIGARVAELHGQAPDRSAFALAGTRVFCLRRDPDADLPALVVRDRPDGPERVLLDPAAIQGPAKGPEHSSLDWYVPSPSGRRVACGLARGGSERAVLRVVDADGGTLLPDEIRGVRHPFVSWAEDERSLIYHRYPDPAAGTPPHRRREDSRSCLHRLGDDPALDRVLLVRGGNPRVPLTRLDRPFLTILPGGWVLAVISHGALGRSLGEWLTDCTVYVAPAAGLADPASCPWARVAGVEDDVAAFAAGTGSLYLVTRSGAPRGRVVAVALGDPAGGDLPGRVELSRARVVVPETDRVVEAVEVVGDRLLVRDLDAGIGRLRAAPLAGGVPREVPLPVEGTIEESARWPGRAAVLLRLASWTSPPRAYRLDLGSGELTDTGWLPHPPTDLGDVEAHEVEVPARDGARIPLSIIHRKGLALDGDNPTLLTGYGSYGWSLRPAYHPGLLAWYERGGVYAVAHLRGGGERGRPWHEAGRGPGKERTITDFIDCAEYLVARCYTRPERLAGDGGSAGGIPTGGALVRRPDLWAAIVMHVPVTNATRFEHSENGPINVPEFGSVTTPEGLRDLLIIDCYLRVQDGVAYPAVLLTAGLDDARVAPWQPAKLAARLQAASTSGRPILLRVERHGGHGIGSTRRQEDDLLADELAFLLDQLA